MPEMLYMVIERFKNRDPVPVYRRFRAQGVEFEVHPVMTSAQAGEQVGS